MKVKDTMIHFLIALLVAVIVHLYFYTRTQNSAIEYLSTNMLRVNGKFSALVEANTENPAPAWSDEVDNEGDVDNEGEVDNEGLQLSPDKVWANLSFFDGRLPATWSQESSFWHSLLKPSSSFKPGAGADLGEWNVSFDTGIPRRIQ